jgi:transmembrane sensor
MKQGIFTQLLNKYAEGTATAQENQLVEAYLTELEKGPVTPRTPKQEAALQARLLKRIQNTTHHKKAPVISIRTWKIAAAAVILFAILGGYLYTTRQQPAEKPDIAITTDLKPGSDKAILTLADGRQIVLTDAANGAIASQGNVKVIKLDGQVSYQPSSNGQQPVLYNTITTPRAGQYQLILSDGTKVWLDAESSIRFPNAFTDAERKVELTGQGYFEVAHNPKKPFHVAAADMDVQVLGTHFNIMAYQNEEAIKTTLLEGRVKVQKGAGPSAILKPGAQARLNREGQLTTIADADLEQAMAWKNGIFQLQGTSIRELFRQIERWYDVDVIYQGTIPNEKLDGKIPRNVNASTVLAALQYTGIRFKIEGKKIYVSP